jgi:FixJ family two-component response regulator
MNEQFNGELVLVVEDDKFLRESLGSLFQSVGVQTRLYESTAELIKSHLPETPSCLVLDVRLPGQSGLDFQDYLARENLHIPIVFITGHGDIPMTVRAMKHGAVEFLTKPFRDQDLLDAVRAGIERAYTQHRIDSKVTDLRARFDRLTPREKQVIELVASGLMNKQIAHELGVSEITVKVHRGNVMHKMQAKSLAELVRMADALGLRKANGK